MWIKKYNPSQNNDGVHDLGFLYKADKVYIMDNHMAAAWCWLNKLDVAKKYNFFHIDRHYDLINNESPQHLKSLEISNKLNIEDYITLQVENTCAACNKQLFRYDNYIMHLFYLLPNLFRQKNFATHNDGSIPERFDIDYAISVDSLPKEFDYQIEYNQGDNWILNLDIDYFFTDLNSTEYIQFLDEEYIDALCRSILKVYNKIDVITIAMSPYFCNGWTNSKRITERITKNLGINIDLPSNYKEY